YFDAFSKVAFEMVDQYHVDLFKFDGTGNADRVFPGSMFDSDFAAAIHLIRELRRREPGLFINLTTGTYPSPFWLLNADSIWRDGDDHNFAGVGTQRQQWITYRDAQTYKNIVQGGPLFPLNSLMLHGMIFAQKARGLNTDPQNDFPDEVLTYFGSGTQLQEMYITPGALSAADWDILARAAQWSRRNASILEDSHWIGGDPGQLQIYGWAAWSPKGWIITLRNPSNAAQEYSLDLGKALELPPHARSSFSVRQPFAASSSTAQSWSVEHSVAVRMKPFEVRVYEWSGQ
ncbi:MAG TPA: enterotoxin, partial [Acidobacteriaceae bacterium]|nr:enterotoxin [Acidobacteriaceae bacterium]